MNLRLHGAGSVNATLHSPVMPDKKDISLIYIEKASDGPSLEEMLTRDLSKESFFAHHGSQTILTGDPINTTLDDILRNSSAPLIAVSLDYRTYYSENWELPLIGAIESGYDLASPVCHDTFNIEVPYYSPSTFNDVAEYMRMKYPGTVLTPSRIPPLAYVVTRESLLRLDPGMSVVELPQRLKSALIPASIIHIFSAYYAFRREDILPFVPYGIVRLLDIGCANGHLGELIKRERNCRVFGVEINKNAAEQAGARLDEVFNADIETTELPFQEDLDVIIFADILEHLSNPWAVLEKAKKWLRPEGCVIASIPNIAHYSVIMDLLRGRWDYIPAGHLCVSHVRFFTKTSIEKMFLKAGYSIHTMEPQSFDHSVKELIMEKLRSFIRIENATGDIFSAGYYLVAKKS